MSSNGGHDGCAESRIQHLAKWAVNLKYEDLPPQVIDRAKELFLDYLACTTAGRHHPAVVAIAQFARDMGAASGRSVFTDCGLGHGSAAFAGLVNGASSHVVEQDDLHNSSMMHPATVVYPAALAAAQDVNATGRDFITACVVGYEVACRVGEYLGKSHYKNFHSTATAGVVGAAAATAKLLQLDVRQTLSAIGTAGTQAAGLWQFLLDASHSKQVHTAKACFDGIFAAYTAKHGLLGPEDILEGKSGMGAVLVSGDTNPVAIDSQLGERFSVMGSSFKWHASCRHTHPSVDGLLNIMTREGIKFEDIESVVARTYQAAIDILTLSEKGETVHQSKFSMGFVLAVAAKYRRASINDFTEQALDDPTLREFQMRVRMEYDSDIDSKFPDQWQGVVIVKTKSGRQFTEHIEVVKGDPGNPLSKNELEAKFLTLANYAGLQDLKMIPYTIEQIWNLEKATDLYGFQFQ